MVELLLQAPHDARVPMGSILAQRRDLVPACAPHGVFEVDVLRHADLVVE
jgi:hypothetical protein